MAYCRQNGKDQIIFATTDDLSKPSSSLIRTDEEDGEEQGLILPSGEINWNCPCLGGMASGPCGVTFREAFTCFHFSEADPKGSDCYQQFRSMQECMAEYPELYPEKDADVDNGVELSKETREQVNNEQVHLVEQKPETTDQKSEEKCLS